MAQITRLMLATPFLQSVLDDEGLRNVFVGTVEGYPEIDDVIAKTKTK